MEREKQMRARPVASVASANKPPQKRKMSEGKLRKREYQKALYIRGILLAKDPSTLTEKQRNSIAWANEVIAKDELTKPKRNKQPKPPSQDAATKAGPSAGGSVGIQGQTLNDKFEPSGTTRGDSTNEAGMVINRKRAWSGNATESPNEDHPQASSTLPKNYTDEVPRESPSEPSSNSLKLAIVDFAHPKGKYSWENGKKIEETLATATLNHIKANSEEYAPKFGKTKWYKGVLLLDCKDQLSHGFAKMTIDGLPLWKGAKLKAVPVEEIPNPPKSEITPEEAAKQKDVDEEDIPSPPKFRMTGEGAKPKSVAVPNPPKFRIPGDGPRKYRISMPETGLQKDQILNTLQEQNPRIQMQGWKVIDEGESSGGFREFIILIDEIPTALKWKTHMPLKFGAGFVHVKTFKETPSTKPEEATHARVERFGTGNQGRTNQPPSQQSRFRQFGAAPRNGASGPGPNPGNKGRYWN